jgi:hypothetical protein
MDRATPGTNYEFLGSYFWNGNSYTQTDWNYIMTMSPEAKATRLAMIKRIAERQAKLKEVKRLSASAMAKTIASEPVNRDRINGLDFDAVIVDDSLNINHWTDAPQYAKEYYGEVAHETTRFDNDWD